MAESDPTQQISIDSVSMDAFKAARQEGKTTVSRAEIEEQKPPEITGKESMEEFKRKRDEQPRGKGGFQRRIDGLIKHNATLEEELTAARQELAGKANGNAVASESSQDSARTENQPDDDPKFAALRQRYPDWDAVQTRAQTGKMRISDEAAQAMHNSPQAGHISYILARNDDFRTELNKLPPAQQVAEIHRMEASITSSENGREFFDRVRSELSKEELSDVHRGIEANPGSAAAILHLVQDLKDLPNGTAVLKLLVHDPKLSQQLAAMPQSEKLIELGRLSARFEGAGSRPVSKAPAPITPVNGGITRSSVPLDEMDMNSYKKARAQGRVR